MSPRRLDVLFVSHFPPSPPTFGAQRRVEGLMVSLARRHRITGLSLVGPDFDPIAAERAMASYCDEAILVPARPERGLGKRLLQVRALLSTRSFERHHCSLPSLRRTIDALLQRRRFDVVSVELPFLAHHRLRVAPPGSPAPRLVVDEHNIEYDLARQSRDASRDPLRRLHHAVNWRKIRREELAAWRDADGVAFTSRDDEARARALVPSLRAAVIPNGVDVEHFRPRPELPPADGQTVVFFGTIDYFPNLDGLRHFFADVWPLLARSHPRARLKVIGPRPTPEILRHRGPRVEVTGPVDDLRPHLAGAGAIVVPLRVGGGTRLKVLEAMAMGKAIVSTRLGAEGIDVAHGREVLLADEPGAFAAAVGQALDDAALSRRLGDAARALVERSYSWAAIGDAFERFLLELVEAVPLDRLGTTGARR